MSYDQAIKWSKLHRMGTNLTMIFSTCSGFWPSKAFLDDYVEYGQECAANGVVPLKCRDYYEATLRRSAP